MPHMFQFSDSSAESPSVAPEPDGGLTAWRTAVTCDAARRAAVDALPPVAARHAMRLVLDVHALPDADALAAFVDSLRAQAFPDWTLVVVRREGTPDPEAGMVAALAHYSAVDPRVLGPCVAVRPERLHTVLDPDAAPVTVLVDRAGRLSPVALARIDQMFRDLPATDMVFADETARAGGIAVTPLLCKPPWDRHYALTRDVFGALKVMRSTVAVNACATSDPGAGPAWFYAHAVRASEMARTDTIRHIAEALFDHPGDPRPDPDRDADERAAVAAAMVRRGRPATVHAVAPGLRRVVPEPACWPSVTVIIPTHDKVDYLRRIVDGLRTDTDYPALDIIIIDNRSREPETLAYLDAIGQAADVRVMPIDAPFNFARLNNLAAGVATGDVLAFLNNDTEVLHADWLREMVAQALRPEVGAVGALLYYPDGRIQHAGVMLGAGHGIADHMGLLMDDAWVATGPGATERPVSAVTAACLVIRAEAFRAVGGFDEAFEVTFNDVDLCLRLAGAGYSNVWTPWARLYHHESVSRGDDRMTSKRERALREERLLRERWGPSVCEDPWHGLAFEPALPGFVRRTAPRSPFPWLERR
ncbi:glycosyltransferase [Roseospira marina]|uniref:Glycosyltransferase n=1 Tax=Roseospira marina TaxID=140057 RepID=A0A5M6I7P6_9PROT|nr:glycosyltransferase family 2 protein [Roseospira marina]KAA5604162.1 glycosyltransferase [Roseospira marina]MBB4315740.1 GT2 family glycosyltransferase [Roseospira marina]MBB5088907.1 GT2 family glycosyltransferase [Roseospira marina]